MAKARTGNRNNQPPPDDEEEETGADAFNDAQRAEISQLVNAAVSGQLQRKLPRAIADGISGPLGEIRSLIEGNQQRGRVRDDDEAGDDDDGEEVTPPKGKGKTKRGREVDPEKEQMRKRLDKLEAERQQEREQSRARERDTLLRESLTKAGVDPNRIRGAIAVLRETTKYDDKTGEWSYVAKRDGFDEEIDIAAGVAEWGKSDEGKSYLAAQTGTQPRGGSGTRPTTTPTGVIGGGGRPAADPKAAKVQAKQAAMEKLTGAVAELGGAAVTLR